MHSIRFSNVCALVMLLTGFNSNAFARYIQADPIGLEGGPNQYAYVGSVGKPLQLNLYQYARNNPVSWIDPLGLFAAGGSLEFSTINPFTSGGGGVMYGINWEYTSSSGGHWYTYSTPNNVGSAGFLPGVSVQVNAATGTGDWTGPFESGAGSYWFITGGYFHTSLDQPDPGYFGISIGGTWGPPGLGFTRTKYKRMFPDSPCK